MHAIVTVIGHDRVGIIAGICVALANVNVNVLDITQTILGGMFTMIMLVDLAEASAPFAEIASALDGEGERLGVNIRIQREDIFNAMHRI
ncbi:MAG: ACT domain-containing protein [Clostridiaceae bacterium]